MKVRIVVMLLSVAGLCGMDGEEEWTKQNRWCWARSDERAEIALKEKDRTWLVKLMSRDFPLKRINDRGQNLLHIGMRLLVETNSEVVMGNVIYLLQEGCDHRARDLNGHTPWEAARKNVSSTGRNTELLDRVEEQFKAGGIVSCQ